MGDVADILGMAPKPTLSAADEAARILAGEKKPQVREKAKKPKGMSREVFSLLGANVDSLLPAMQSNKPNAGFKNKRTSAL
jgi:hypothetical protein